MELLLRALDVAFFLFHTLLIGFIVLGWAWRKVRTVHLGVVTATAFSWFVLGLWYGFGYCPCTDWHWQVRTALGHTDMPWSYIKFLGDGITGLDLSPWWVDVVTVSAFFLAALLSVVLNVRDRKR